MLQVLNVTLPAKQPPKLLDKVRAVIRTKHYSLRTEQAYTQWIKCFILFHLKRHPRDMGALEINQFLSHLAVKENVVLRREEVKTVLQQLAGVKWLMANLLYGACWSVCACAFSP